MGATHLIGMLCAAPAATCGKADSIHARWMKVICGRRCATGNSIRFAPAWFAGRSCGGGRALPRIAALATDRAAGIDNWNRRWSKQTGKDFLAEGETEEELAAIRQCTHTGRPLGAASFVRTLEDATQRRLAPGKGGRPKTALHSRSQATLDFYRANREPEMRKVPSVPRFPTA